MSASFVHVTPFEEELLQVMRALVTRGLDPCLHGTFIARQARLTFGEAWLGPCRSSRYGRQYHPKIDMALGRLAKKGLIERVETSKNVPWGHWSLTQIAQDLLVISAAPF